MSRKGTQYSAQLRLISDLLFGEKQSHRSRPVPRKSSHLKAKRLLTPKETQSDQRQEAVLSSTPPYYAPILLVGLTNTGQADEQ